VVAAITPYIMSSMDHTMKQVDGGTGGYYVYKACLDPFDRFRKTLPVKSTPIFAMLAWVVNDPVEGELVVADKAAAGIFAVWSQGMSGLSYDRSWCSVQTKVFENALLTAEPKRLLHKGFEVPALSISYAGFAGSTVVGVMARTPADFRTGKAQALIRRMLEIIGGAG